MWSGTGRPDKEFHDYLESEKPEEKETLEISRSSGRTWLCSCLSCEAATLLPAGFQEGKIGKRTANTIFLLPRLRGETPPKGFFEKIWEKKSYHNWILFHLLSALRRGEPSVLPRSSAPPQMGTLDGSPGGLGPQLLSLSPGRVRQSRLRRSCRRGSDKCESCLRAPRTRQ